MLGEGHCLHRCCYVNKPSLFSTHRDVTETMTSKELSLLKIRFIKNKKNEDRRKKDGIKKDWKKKTRIFGRLHQQSDTISDSRSLDSYGSRIHLLKKTRHGDLCDNISVIALTEVVFFSFFRKYCRGIYIRRLNLKARRGFPMPLHVGKEI